MKNKILLAASILAVAGIGGFAVIKSTEEVAPEKLVASKAFRLPFAPKVKNFKLRDSEIDFRIKKLRTLNVDGKFKASEGKLSYDKKSGFLRKGKVVINLDSLKTDNEDRDDHLKSSDFFDVQKYKVGVYSIDTVIAPLNVETNVEGELNLHGVTKKVVFKLLLKEVKGEIVAKLRGHLKRSDFNLNWNKKKSSIGLFKTSIVGEYAHLNIIAKFAKE